MRTSSDSFGHLVQRRRLVDGKALLLLATLAGVTYAWHARQPRPAPRPPDLQPFAQKYRPSDNSQWGEEWLIRDFFQDRRGGLFVDVGTNHHQWFSNTYYLNVVLGWTGIAVDPQTQFAAGYSAHRQRTRFRPFFVSDASDQQAKLYVLKSNPLVPSADKNFTEKWGSGAETITAATITLNDLLAAKNIEQFDFLNMDIETWEPKALAGLDIQRFKPSAVQALIGVHRGS